MQKKSKGIGKYFRTGDVVCVEMDMDNNTISFVVAGVKTLAYSDVPTDNPLVPCVIFKCMFDSIQLITEADKAAADDPDNDDKDDKDCIIS